MRILVVKTSSLGDIIHTLAALTDACNHNPHLQFDWLVEEAFAEIPSWHFAVKKVIPVALRRWRKQFWQTWRNNEWKQFVNHLTQQRYDKIIDAQGLIKSAFLTYQAHGIRCGLDYQSAREPLANYFYQQTYRIEKQQHAVTRVRQLFAAILEYDCPIDLPNYAIKQYFASNLIKHKKPTIIFLHGTTWVTKHWSDKYWIKLAKKIVAAGFFIRLPYYNELEYQRATKIAAIHPNISIMPKTGLYEIAVELAQAKAIIGVDTGLAHLTAALDIPAITLYGATRATKTGTYGKHQIHLQSDFHCSPCLNKKCRYQVNNILPCYKNISVERVWKELKIILEPI
ncbi:MAG: lipopolysaccharide heptosyltransferase I [Thiomargarita sp.]|nr:lipopolysaccharide heptosyltransferase I [Thiomargarita sp.]